MENSNHQMKKHNFHNEHLIFVKTILSNWGNLSFASKSYKVAVSDEIKPQPQIPYVAGSQIFLVMFDC